MTRLSFAIAILCGSCCGVASARADILILKDGRILEREKMEATDKGVRVHFEHGSVVVPAEQIQEAILPGGWPPAGGTESDADAENRAKGLVHYDGKWVKPEVRNSSVAKRIAERKAFVEKLRHHSLWRNRHKDETAHFTFEYTVAPFVYDYFRDMMEAYYTEFAKTWKIKQPKDLGKLRVCFYADSDEFVQIGGAGYGVLGYFRFVKPLELNFFYSREDPELTEQVLYHEANHYLQLLMSPDFNMPHFPGEALAEYYGACKFDPATKKLATGLVLEGRLTEVKTDIAAGDVMSLEKMLRAEQMYEHYTWGWTLAHFLMNDKRYRKKFEGFVKGLVFGKDVRRESSIANMRTVPGDEVYAHFRRSMGLKKDEDFKALEAEWHTYVKDTLQTTTTRGLELAGSAAARVNRPILAKRMYKEAIEAGSTSALAYHQYAELLSQDGKHKEALEYYEKAVELGPLESEFYADLGRTLIRLDQYDEGIRTLMLARELDPDNPWLETTIERYKKDAEKDAR